MGADGADRRVAIVAGLRTPFVKSGTEFAEVTALDLAVQVTSELLQRSNVEPNDVDQVVFGQVVPTLTATAIAREVVLRTGMPKSIPAHTVARACATSIQSLTDGANEIASGHAEVVVAGGAESLTDIPIHVSKRLSSALVRASQAKSVGSRLRAFRGVKAADLVPVPPGLTEPTTGLSMGESCEKMAKENHISREEQDGFALRSHQNAARAWASGSFEDEVMTAYLPPRYSNAVSKDNIVRSETSLEALAKLPPVFDRKYGTLTAGNSSPLTDGAAALLLMSAGKARSMGVKPLGYLKDYAYAACDPSEQLLMGPAYAAPRVLDRCKLGLGDIDVFEMHEAFAAQVLSNLMGFASKTWAKEKLGRAKPIGDVDPARLNLRGGSISLGHPFGATGARLVHQALRELERRNGQYAMLTVCAAGGLGAAVILERN
jgi:acetyl-CoA acyltransferase